MKNLLIAILILVSLPAAGHARDAAESAKIDHLISAVEHLQAATFVRNGTEHTPREAAEHLRLKLNKAGSRVRTAGDFITLCASRSSVSGKPYLIRYDNGTVIEAEAYLREKLKVFETAGK